MPDERPVDVLAALPRCGRLGAGHREFLREHEVDPDSIRSLADFRGLG
jgi:hypothetical protein